MPPCSLAVRVPRHVVALLLVALTACQGDKLEGLPLAPLAVTAPNIFVTPLAQDYASITLNQQASQRFTVGNSGDGPLVIERIVIDGPQAYGFTLAENTISASVLGPRETSTGLVVAFSPDLPDNFTAVLEVWSNDTDENPVRIPLDGGGRSGGPVALCTATPSSVTLPAATTLFDGSASYDSAGLLLTTFAWTLSEAPAGSGAALGCGNQETCPFVADLAGVYAATLAVTNSVGQTSSCRAELTVLAAAHPPEARCSITPTTIDLAAPQPATFVGSASSDADGDALVAFAWSLQARPVGSTAAMPSCGGAADCGPFVPDLPGAYTGRLQVTDSTGLRDSCVTTLQVTRSGQGPVAVCEVTPDTVHPPFESATWKGTGSYDPDGYALVRYTWLLTSKPDGSAVGMPACGNNATCGPFAPDLAGTYVAQLTVENSLAMTASCTVELEAVPRQNLWVEMFWAHSGDDMDLHLLKPGGTLRSAGDCYFMNCIGGGPDWGQAGAASDNPSLDLDDISGTGPENINIGNPAAGLYTVVVHDYPGSVYQSANSVTVNVYVDGTQVFTATRSVSGEDTHTNFCTISWPSGVVTAL